MPLIPTPRRTRSIWLALLICLAVFLVIAAFVQLDHSISGMCQLSPSTQWTLSERRVGSYESKTVDMVSGRILQYRLYQFDRPACLDLDLSGTHNATGHKVPVVAGQSVVTMKSSSLELELAERTTALAEARASLNTLRGGRKPESIRAARLELERCRAELDTYRPQYERQERLYAEGIISDTVWEETSTRYRLLGVDVDLAQAEVDVLTSDARPEKIAAIEVTISSLERELQAVADMMSAQEISTPISGYLHVDPDSGLLVSVSDCDTMIVKMLVPQKCAFNIEPNQELRVAIPGVTDGLITGQVLRLDPTALVTRGGVYVTVYGMIDNVGGRLEGGMQGRSRVYCGRSTLLQRVRDNLLQALNREFIAL